MNFNPYSSHVSSVFGSADVAKMKNVVQPIDFEELIKAEKQRREVR